MEVKAEARIKYTLGSAEILALRTACEVLDTIYEDLEGRGIENDDDIDIPGWEFSDLWTAKGFIRDFLKEVEK